MSNADVIDEHADVPERTVWMDVEDETVPVLVCLWGLVLAEEKGFDLSDLDVADEDGQSVEAKQMLDLLWIGMLPFDESLTRKEVGMKLTVGAMQQAREAFDKIKSRQITQDVKEHVDGKKK